MPYTTSHFDSLLAMTALCNDTELQALTDKCQQLIADREHTKREELRQELMANLQQVIGAILGNGFDLTIANTERNYIDGHEDVWFCPDDHYHIEIE